jgi:hypothetical protein
MLTYKHVVWPVSDELESFEEAEKCKNPPKGILGEREEVVQDL